VGENAHNETTKPKRKNLMTVRGFETAIQSPLLGHYPEGPCTEEARAGTCDLESSFAETIR